MIGVACFAGISSITTINTKKPLVDSPKYVKIKQKEIRFDISKYIKPLNNKPILKEWSLYGHLLNKDKTDFEILVNTAGCNMIVFDGKEYSYHDVIVGKLRGRKHSKYDFRTPKRKMRVSHVVFNPWWHPPHRWWAKKEKDIPPGPNNPLGPMKIILKNSSYRIHGNNMKLFHSGHISHGCIRMRNDEAIELGKKVNGALHYGKKVIVNIVYKPVVLETFNIENTSFIFLTVYPNYYHEKVNYKKELKTQVALILKHSQEDISLDITPLLKNLRKPGTYLYKVKRGLDKIVLEKQEYAPLYVVKNSKDTIDVYVNSGMSFSTKRKILKRGLGKRYNNEIANNIIYKNGKYRIIFNGDSINITTSQNSFSCFTRSNPVNFSYNF